MKKFVSLLLSLVIAFVMISSMPYSELPFGILANAVQSGTCGDELTWTLDDNGVLTVSGNGPMTEFYYKTTPWYESYESIESVVVENGVTTIGKNAFYGLTSLKSAVIADSVTSIGLQAFGVCRQLASIDIPESVTDIDDYAFYACSTLSSIIIPDSVTSIGEYAFAHCSNVKSLEIGDGVTELCIASFSECKNLESVTLGSNIRTIGALSFYKCESLKVINNLDGVKYIDDHSFRECVSLTSIAIPDSVKGIGIGAFELCTSLENISIHDNVTHIGENAFYGASYYDNADNWENDALYIDNHLIKVNDTVSESFSVKESTRCIADLAFSASESLTSVNIPIGVKSIGAQAISGCVNLKSVTVPSTVIYIGDNALGYSSGEKIDGFIIYGTADSLAESYANENGFTFVEIVEVHTHTPQEWIIDVEPTCTTVGEKHTVCSICEETVVEEISALDHLYSDEWTIDVEPTYATEGSKSRQCSRCGETDVAVISVKDFNDIIYAVADGEVYNGEITYIFYLKAKVTIKGAVVNIVFDSDALEPVESKCGAYFVSDSSGNLSQNLSGMYASGLKNNTDNTYILSYANSGSVKKSSDKAFMQVTFRVKDYTKAQSEMNFYCVEFNSPDSTYNVPKNEKKPAVIGSYIVDIAGGYYDLKGTENTRIDYENKLVFTTSYGCQKLEDMFSLGENITASHTASYIDGDTEFCGTGTKVSLYGADEYIGDYIIIVIGDLNADGFCDVLDAALAEKISTGRVTDVTTAQIYAANGCVSDTIDTSSYQNVVNTSLNN